MFRAPPLHIQGHPHSGYPAPMGVGATSSSGRWPEGSEKRLDSTRTGWGERSKGQVTTSGASSSELWGESGGFGVLLLPCLLPIVSNKSAGSAKNLVCPCSRGSPPATSPSCLPASQGRPSFWGGGLRAVFMESILMSGAEAAGTGVVNFRPTCSVPCTERLTQTGRAHGRMPPVSSLASWVTAGERCGCCPQRWQGWVSGMAVG